MPVLGSDDGRTRRAAAALRRSVTGGVALRSDDRYAEACRIWNHGVRRRPAMIALCRCPENVAFAVRTAREHGLPVSVRGGGHDWAGRALCQDGMVVDLSGMRGVTADPRAKVATIMGSALTRDAAAACAPHGLVAALGTCGGGVVAGLTLGGGYALAMRTCWLPALLPEAVAAIVDALAQGIPGAAPFGLRRPHLTMEIMAWWPLEEDGARQRQWADDLWDALAPSALPGGYVNLLGPDHVDQAREAYGGNAARLRAAKRRFDPDVMSASAIPLPPG